MNTAAHTAHTLQEGRATRRRPTAAPYWLLALLAVAGIAAAITWATFRTLDTIGRVDDFARTAIPGTAVAHLAEHGTLVVYFEGNGKPTPAELGLTVSGPDGARIPVQQYEQELQYDAPQGLGVASAVASFQAANPGRYLVSATETPQHGARLAVGEDVGRGLISALVWPGVLALAVVVSSALAVQTNRRKDRMLTGRSEK
jgi:hypothetical protein